MQSTTHKQHKENTCNYIAFFSNSPFIPYPDPVHLHSTPHYNTTPVMKVISFDIGIVNLAYCILEVDTNVSSTSVSTPNWKVLHWNLINLRTPASTTSPSPHPRLLDAETETETETEPAVTLSTAIPVKCCEKTKKGDACNRPVKYQKMHIPDHEHTHEPTSTMNYYCATHARPYLPETHGYDFRTLQPHKMSVVELKATLTSLRIPVSQHPSNTETYSIDRSVKKAQLVDALNTYLVTHFVQPYSSSPSSKKTRHTLTTTTDGKKKGKKSAPKVNWELIAHNIARHLDAIGISSVGFLSETDRVLVENQIGPLANKMKTVQGMITQYFVMKQYPLTVDIVDARHKLLVECKEGGVAVLSSSACATANTSRKTTTANGKHTHKHKHHAHPDDENTTEEAIVREKAFLRDDDDDDNENKNKNKNNDHHATDAVGDGVGDERKAEGEVNGDKSFKVSPNIISAEVRKEYKNRKRSSVDVTLEFLDQCSEMHAWKSHFQSFKKKDDMADCFLQGVWWILSSSATATAKSKTSKSHKQP